MIKETLVFIGNELLSSAHRETAPILQSLLEKGCKIEAVCLRNKPTRSRQQKQLGVLTVAKQYNVPIIEMNSADSTDKLLELKSRWAILASCGWLLSEKVLAHFSGGIVNIHPSLLPAYRGSTPIESAILNGEKQTGISLLQLSQHMDAGDIYAQSETVIDIKMSKLELSERLARQAASLLTTHLQQIIDGKLVPQKQSSQNISYTPQIRARIVDDLRMHPASYWERYIRAFKGCPNNRFIVAGQQVSIDKAYASNKHLDHELAYDKQKHVLLCRCQTGRLEVSRLTPANRRLMSAKEFVNGFGRNITKI